MYRFVASYLKPVGAAQTYQNIDISLKTLDWLHHCIVDGYIELSNNFLKGHVYLTIQEFKMLKLPHRLDQTFEYWLSYIGNATIPASAVKPNYHTSLVFARNAIQASYSVRLVKRSMQPHANIPIGDMNDLYVYKAGVNLTRLHTRTLTTVNGYLHPCVPYYQGLAVVGGGSLHKQLGSHNVGLLSFNSVGDIQQAPITKERVHKFNAATLLSDKVVINTGIDLTGKSIIVSLGGYPLISSPLVTIVSETDGILKIDTRSFDIPRHINGSIGQVNLETLGIIAPETDRGMPALSNSYLRSDLVTMHYLTLPQSFVAVVDTPTLSVEREAVSLTGLPDRFIHHKEPNLPLMDSAGRLVEYHITPQNGPFMVSVPHAYYERYLVDTIQQYEYDEHTRVLPVDGFQPHHYDFLKMISVSRVTER